MPEKHRHEFAVRGLHCHSCVLLVEDAFGNVSGVKDVRVDLEKGCVRLCSADDPKALVPRLNEHIRPHGYELLADAPDSADGRKARRELLWAVPLALALIGVFVLLARLRLFDIGLNGEMNYGLAMIIGLMASVSTCLAVVGSLALSVTANQAHAGARWTAPAAFHLGRLGGFFLLGGAVGWAGRSLQPGPIGALVVNLAVAAIMLILGLNLLDVFPFLRRLEMRMPRRLGRIGLKAGRSNGRLIPLLAGAGTFFLPCGFTQAMQFQALASDGFWRGGLLMLAFALGTLPVLAALSFGAFSVRRLAWRGLFFKTAGLIVIVFSIIGAWNALAVAGVMPPLLA